MFFTPTKKNYINAVIYIEHVNINRGEIEQEKGPCTFGYISTFT